MEPSPRSGSRAKLSCGRCKRKKIRCDKADPQCDKCSASGAECVYAQRRQRTRKRQEQNVVDRLSRQLEFLESHITNISEPATLSHQSPETSATVNNRTTDVGFNSGNINTQEASQEPETSENESGVFYRMVNDARNTTISKLCDKDLLQEDARPNVNNALVALNGALAALGNLRVSPDASPTPDPDHVLTQDEKKTCIENSFELMSAIMFTPPIDMELIRAMPDFIDSPYVHVDPAAKLIYYTLIFEGRTFGPKRSSTAAKNDYINCLQAVPAWHESASGSVMDMIAALATTMVAISCFDYHLGWKFHCEACRFAEQLGLDSAVIPPPSEGGPMKPDLRGAFWCLVQLDLFFKLFYDKPAAIKPSTTRRIASNATIPVSSRVKPGPTIIFILWTRIFFILTKFFDYIESHNIDRNQPSDTFKHQVRSFCDQIEEVLDDWTLSALLKSQEGNALFRWLHADLMIGAHTIIILMERRMFGDGHIPVSPHGLRSGRSVVRTIIEMSDTDCGISHHILSFYPFSAFFALYYHILSCTNPDESKEDVEALEKIGQVFERVKLLRSEFIPISNAVNALNHISRVIHESLTSSAARNKQSTSSLPPEGVSQQEDSLTSSTQQSYALGLDYMSGVDVPQMNFLDSTMDLPIDFSEGFQPMGYTRAIENEFVGRNWHESWWSFS